jgi:hypothetical protein
MIALHLGRTKKRKETRQKNFAPEAAGINPIDYGDFFSFQGAYRLEAATDENPLKPRANVSA